jgi:hypothetical protein
MKYLWIMSCGVSYKCAENGVFCFLFSPQSFPSLLYSLTRPIYSHWSAICSYFSYVCISCFKLICVSYGYLLFSFSCVTRFWATVGMIIYVRKMGIDHLAVAKAGSRMFQAQVRVLIFIFTVLSSLSSLLSSLLSLLSLFSLLSAYLLSSLFSLPTSLLPPPSSLFLSSTPSLPPSL